MNIYTGFLSSKNGDRISLVLAFLVLQHRSEIENGEKVVTVQFSTDGKVLKKEKARKDKD